MLYCNNNSVNSKFNIPCNQWEVLDISRKCFDITGCLLTLEEFVSLYQVSVFPCVRVQNYDSAFSLTICRPTMENKIHLNKILS